MGIGFNVHLCHTHYQQTIAYYELWMGCSCATAGQGKKEPKNIVQIYSAPIVMAAFASEHTELSPFAIAIPVPRNG